MIVAMACSRYYLFAVTDEGKLFARSASVLVDSWQEIDAPPRYQRPAVEPPDPSESCS
jgi:hypothetical protein